jgi:hypothetical protein
VFAVECDVLLPLALSLITTAGTPAFDAEIHAEQLTATVVGAGVGGIVGAVAGAAGGFAFGNAMCASACTRDNPAFVLALAGAAYASIAGVAIGSVAGFALAPTPSGDLDEYDD